MVKSFIVLTVAGLSLGVCMGAEPARVPHGAADDALHGGGGGAGGPRGGAAPRRAALPRHHYAPQESHR